MTPIAQPTAQREGGLQLAAQRAVLEDWQKHQGGVRALNAVSGSQTFAGNAIAQWARAGQ